MPNYMQIIPEQAGCGQGQLIAGQFVLGQPYPGTAVSMILARKERGADGRVLRADKIPELKTKLEGILQRHSVPGRYIVFYTEKSSLRRIGQEREEIEEEYLRGTRLNREGTNVKTPTMYHPLWGTYFYIWAMTHDLKRMKKEIFAHFNLADMKRNSNGDEDGDEYRI